MRHVLYGFLLAYHSCFLIPGCLHTSLDLWLACWIISKPGVGHDIVVILWFVKCFVMDCLNWRLIKYWQLWQNATCVSLLCGWVTKIHMNLVPVETISLRTSYGIKVPFLSSLVNLLFIENMSILFHFMLCYVDDVWIPMRFAKSY